MADETTHLPAHPAPPSLPAPAATREEWLRRFNRHRLTTLELRTLAIVAALGGVGPVTIEEMARINGRDMATRRHQGGDHRETRAMESLERMGLITAAPRGRGWRVALAERNGS